ncbi:MAG: hypothetical protein ACI30M_08145 [Muribaculaceae bacterium]
MNNGKYTILIPSEDCEEKLKEICDVPGIEYDDEPQANLIGTIVSSIAFGIIGNAIWDVLKDLIPYFSSLGIEKRVILITPSGLQYRNISLQQALEILKKENNESA